VKTIDARDVTGRMSAKFFCAFDREV